LCRAYVVMRAFASLKARLAYFVIHPYLRNVTCVDWLRKVRVRGGG